MDESGERHIAGIKAGTRIYFAERREVWPG
jgi:hypothetical protein